MRELKFDEVQATSGGVPAQPNWLLPEVDPADFVVWTPEDSPEYLDLLRKQLDARMSKLQTGFLTLTQQ